MGVIDLRPHARSRKPLQGQRSLFTSAPAAPRPPREERTRPLPLRARRRRVRLIFAIGTLVFVAALAWGAHYASYLPKFTIRSVTVVGAEHVPPQVIADYVRSILDDGTYHFFSRRNIFLYPRAAIESDIVSYFPRIASAHLSRDTAISTQLTVTVIERTPFALWCESPQTAGAASSTVPTLPGAMLAQPSVPAATCYEMDAGGFLYALATGLSIPATQYRFEGGLSGATSTSPYVAATAPGSPVGRIFALTHLPSLVSLLTTLGQAGFTPTTVAVENDTDFSVEITDTAASSSFMVKASFGEDAGTLVKNLQLVLSSGPLQGQLSGLQYIDLRFGNRVYYKLYGGSASTSIAH